MKASAGDWLRRPTVPFTLLPGGEMSSPTQTWRLTAPSSIVPVLALMAALSGAAAGAQPAGAPPPGTGRISGSVIDADSGRAVRLATVRLVRAAAGTWQATTD